MAHILIVDDDLSIRSLLRYAFEVAGYTVSTLEDGRRVVEVLAGEHPPQVLLLDVMMPYVDGWEVCRRVERAPELLARCRLVLMTAVRIEDGTMPACASALLYKPFDLDAALALVHDLCATPLAAHATRLGAGPSPVA